MFLLKRNAILYGLEWKIDKIIRDRRIQYYPQLNKLINKLLTAIRLRKNIYLMSESSLKIMLHCVSLESLWFTNEQHKAEQLLEWIWISIPRETRHYTLWLLHSAKLAQRKRCNARQSRNPLEMMKFSEKDKRLPRNDIDYPIHFKPLSYKSSCARLKRVTWPSSSGYMGSSIACIFSSCLKGAAAVCTGTRRSADLTDTPWFHLIYDWSLAWPAKFYVGEKNIFSFILWFGSFSIF